ncbi:MAG: peptide deformylase [Rhodothermaceae bacterium]|nr:peptide deformylase [Rhodothermaceae bacterium]
MAILPIRLLGDPVLRQQTRAIESVDNEIKQLIGDMMETMHNAAGVGLAAPQVGYLEQLFVVDISPLLDELPEDSRDKIPKQPMVLINPEITWESEEEEEFEEGCLSIPDIREIVVRPESVELNYQDENMQEQKLTVDGILARVIQHEFDHLEGLLFTDHLSSFRRGILKRKLEGISQGKTEATYPVQSYSRHQKTS